MCVCVCVCGGLLRSDEMNDFFFFFFSFSYSILGSSRGVMVNKLD